MTQQNQNPEGGKRAYFKIDFKQIDSLDAKEKADHFKALHQHIVAAFLGGDVNQSDDPSEAGEDTEGQVSA
ncbi:MAG: hypothetical protein RL149_549 [Actinomycetota bacterium]|jgi:hypothetical protein